MIENRQFATHGDILCKPCHGIGMETQILLRVRWFASHRFDVRHVLWRNSSYACQTHVSLESKARYIYLDPPNT